LFGPQVRSRRRAGRCCRSTARTPLPSMVRGSPTDSEVLDASGSAVAASLVVLRVAPRASQHGEGTPSVGETRRPVCGVNAGSAFPTHGRHAPRARPSGSLLFLADSRLWSGPYYRADLELASPCAIASSCPSGACRPVRLTRATGLYIKARAARGR
jgi:hypothetical protein